MKTPLKKDPEGMYSDLPIDPNRDLKDLNKSELEKLSDVMTDTDVLVDENPALEEVYETYGADREQRKIAIENEIKVREARNSQKGK